MRVATTRTPKDTIGTRAYRATLIIAGAVAPIAIWAFAKAVFHVPDRYLPHPLDVIQVLYSDQGSVYYHLAVSSCRIILSFVASIVLSLFLGATLYKFEAARHLSLPFIQSVRTIPAAATVPFFILWFGFAEYGRFILFISGVSFNLIISVLVILENMREKYRIAFHGFQMRRERIPYRILFPFALEGLLPTLRFSVTVLIGLSVIAELLGAQSGLGYLIQSARTTYALHVLVACAILYGILSIIIDTVLRALWKLIVPWQET
jgi:sulfonate transport system permease protein